MPVEAMTLLKTAASFAHRQTKPEWPTHLPNTAYAATAGRKTRHCHHLRGHEAVKDPAVRAGPQCHAGYRNVALGRRFRARAVRLRPGVDEDAAADRARYRVGFWVYGLQQVVQADAGHAGRAELSGIAEDAI